MSADRPPEGARPPGEAARSDAGGGHASSNERLGSEHPAARLRRLEEIGLNASGPANPRFFDGWVLGFTPGRTKRARSINPFFGSSLPVAAKLAACHALYAEAALPLIVRMTPFAEPPDLDEWLAANGYARFDDTLVMVRGLADWIPARTARSRLPCEALDLYAWTTATQDVRELSDDQVRRILDRQDTLHLAGCGMLVRQRGTPLAWGMAQIEEGWAGLYNIETRASHRRAGLGRRVVHALLDYARTSGAADAYLQVTATNAPAIALYRSLGFAEAYRYWYRARPEVIEHERR
jgi:ribosomal protein S18 acetylase RimI-like enzyme